jgi:hypothetical protein
MGVFLPKDEGGIWIVPSLHVGKFLNRRNKIHD